MFVSSNVTKLKNSPVPVPCVSELLVVNGSPSNVVSSAGKGVDVLARAKKGMLSAKRLGDVFKAALAVVSLLGVTVMMDDDGSWRVWVRSTTGTSSPIDEGRESRISPSGLGGDGEGSRILSSMETGEDDNP